jgi:hypothetical protein
MMWIQILWTRFNAFDIKKEHMGSQLQECQVQLIDAETKHT